MINNFGINRWLKIDSPGFGIGLSIDDLNDDIWLKWDSAVLDDVNDDIWLK